MKTIAVYHNKGGVGKTTTVVNLAAGLARKDYRVLVIDMDPQANATLALGLAGVTDEHDRELRARNFAHLVQRRLDAVSDYVRRSDFGDPAVDVVPSHISVHREFDKPMVALNDAIKARLVFKLRQEAKRWDVVLIDVPPAANVLADIALITADSLIVPSDLKPFAFSGLETVKELVARADEVRVDRMKRPKLDILGVLPSKISTNAAFRERTLPKRIDRVRARYDVRILDSIISERDGLAKSVDREVLGADGELLPEPRSIFSSGLRSESDKKAAQEFEDLTDEVIGRAGISR